MDVISLHANNSLYGSEGKAEEDEEDESKSSTSEGSPHSDILSYILSAERILDILWKKLQPVHSLLHLFLWLRIIPRH